MISRHVQIHLIADNFKSHFAGGYLDRKMKGHPFRWIRDKFCSRRNERFCAMIIPPFAFRFSALGSCSQSEFLRLIASTFGNVTKSVEPRMTSILLQHFRRAKAAEYFS